MLKKCTSLIIVLSCLFVVCCSYFCNSVCYLGKFKGSFEVYLNSDSSSAEIILVEKNMVEKFINRKGEAVFINALLNPFEVIKEFGATLVHVEFTTNGESYYAYAPTIKFSKTLKNKRINLHIHVSDNGTKIGTPIIFGSF